ncbi:MAG TPA: protein kinase [Saprospiraceae bacterium]|nr:protein kinase [Saprospiraceae bacterium]
MAKKTTATQDPLPRKEDQTIETMLIQGKLDEALDRIGEINRATLEQADLWAGFKSQLTAYRKAYEQGEIEHEEFQRHHNRLGQAVLGLIQGVTRAIQPYFHFYTSNPLNDVDSNSLDALLVYVSTRLEGKYQVFPRPLGVGNSCIVFKIKDLYSGRYEVLRVLKTSRLKGLAEEINQVSRLKHRNIMSVHELYFKEFPYFVTTEYVPSESLDVYIDRFGRRPFFEVRDMALRLGDAVQYLRDKKIYLTQIRPSKILLDTENQPVISPFEVIKASDASRAKEKVKEDALYLAPEMLEDEKAVYDAETAGLADQYSLGLLMFEQLTGKPVFADDNLKGPRGGRRSLERLSLARIFKNRERFDDPEDKFRASCWKMLEAARVPAELLPVLDRLLRRAPEERYPGFDEALDAIAAIPPGWTDTQRAVMESFQRCLRSNDDFIDRFYEKVQSCKDLPDELIQYSDLAQQQRMFRGVLTLLIDSGQHPFVEGLTSLKGHKGLSADHYRKFLDLLLETVAETDSYWPKRDDLRAAWFDLSERLIGSLKF